MSTTTLIAPVAADTTGIHTRPGLGRLVAVELRKVVDTRAGFWLQVATVVLAAEPAGEDRRLVDAEPEEVARAAMAGGVVLRRIAPAEDAGLERLFFELTAAGAGAPSATTDPIHPELAGATA